MSIFLLLVCQFDAKESFDLGEYVIKVSEEVFGLQPAYVLLIAPNFTPLIQVCRGPRTCGMLVHQEINAGLGDRQARSFEVGAKNVSEISDGGNDFVVFIILRAVMLLLDVFKY